MGMVQYQAGDDRPGGGLLTFTHLDLGVTGRIAKPSPGRLYGWQLGNNGAAAAYVKLYNKATAPTQADTPLLTIRIPAGGAVTFTSAIGVGFTAGISARGVTAPADNSVAAPAANDLVVALFYV
jgi:hypothetical protein